MDGRPILPSGSVSDVGCLLVDAASSFRQEREFLYISTWRPSSTSPSHFTNWPFFPVFFFRPFISLICTAYPSVPFFFPLHCFVFLFFPPKKNKQTSYFVCNREPRPFSTQSLSRIPKSPVMYSNKWTRGNWFDWKFFFGYETSTKRSVDWFHISTIWFNG